MQKLKYMLLCLPLLTVSACTQEKATATDLTALATPKIERLQNGYIEFDRLPMIPFKYEQPCTEVIAAIARLNPRDNTIEICIRNQWKAEYVAKQDWIGNDVEKTKLSKKKPVKK